jgi:recombination protein RecA
LGITPQEASQLIGEGVPRRGKGVQEILGNRDRLRRDHLERLADALDSEFLRHVLDEDVWYDRIVSVSSPEWRPIYDIEVGEDHTFVANDVVVSNCASPFRQAEFDITYGKGISREGSLIDVGVDLGLVKKSGAWFTYEGEQLGQGRENAKAFLADNLEVMVEISERIRQAAGLAPPSDSPAPAPADADANGKAKASANPDDQPITLD